MLQNVLVSRKAADFVAEGLIIVLTAAFLVKFSVILLFPLGLALVAIPLVVLAWLPGSKAGLGFAVLAIAVAVFTQAWAYFLFQLIHKAHYGHSFALPLS